MSFKGDVFAQTRTSHGAIPIANTATLHGGKPCEPGPLAEEIYFEPLPPTKAARQKAAMRTNAAKQTISNQLEGLSEQRSQRSNLPLLQLAISMSLSRQEQEDGSVFVQNTINSIDLLDFAKNFGPLVGRAPITTPVSSHALSTTGAFKEPITFWASAGATANLAVSIQEFVSQNIAFEALVAKLPSITKQQVNNPKTGNSFSIFTIPIPTSKDYAEWLGVPAFIRRDAALEHIDYSFILTEEFEDDFYVDLVVASFKNEITAQDYQLLSAACNLTPEIDEDVYERLELEGVALKPDDSNASANNADQTGFATDELLGQEVPILKEDLSVLRSMVRALIAAHMRDARVDLFSSDEETGYLAFDSLLSWLWYDFSKGLDIARIRYCARCGKAFPLVGHRGPDKLFCSTICKNDARNDRNGQRRNKVRELFREQNMSVAELAAQNFTEEGQKEGERRVREYLSSWPTLKHDIDDDIAEYGWKDSPLLKRCLKEGLDPKRFLSSKRQTELKAQKGH